MPKLNTGLLLKLKPLKGDIVRIADVIEIELVAIDGDQAKIAIRAPAHINIARVKEDGSIRLRRTQDELPRRLQKKIRETNEDK